MRTYWNRFGVWVIGLKDDPFTRARIKLTIFYTIIISALIIFYLGLLYQEFNRNIHTFAKENIPKIDRRVRFIQRSTKVTTFTLFHIETEDIAMFIITIILSYWLAGFALKPIKKNIQEQKQFLTDVSHELRTPLAIVKTDLEVFLRDKRNWVNKKELLLRKKQSIVSNLEEINRMSKLVDNLLLMARMGVNQEKFQFSVIEVNRLLTRIVHIMKNSSNEEKITLRLNIKKPIYIFADPDKLQQAFINILTNSIKYSKEKREIVIQVLTKENIVEIQVIDNGIGITKEDLPYIFDRFYRANHDSSANGSGLGLAIVKKIIQKHKGAILVKSTFGEGTTVAISLPIKHFS